VKIKSVVYWTATALIGLETLAGGYVDLTHGLQNVFNGRPVVDIVTELGYPLSVLTILGVWKILGAIVLFAPRLPRLKEWAYAGITFELTAAAALFAMHGGTISDVMTPVILAILGFISWALRPPSRTLGTLLPARVRTKTDERKGSIAYKEAA
jgi:uncharacterized membrane protein YphA (DoxX/SURF4 family)